MDKNQKIYLGCLSIGAGLFVFFVLPKMFFWPISIHMGDGTFANISHRMGPFAIQGYAISMAAFDMGEAFQKEYQVSGLANIGCNCGIYLSILGYAPESLNEEKPGGFLELEILDTHGDKIVFVQGSLKEFVWMSESGKDSLYQPGKSFFNPDPKMTYRLRIHYQPKSDLAGIKAFVYLRSKPG